MNAQVASTAQRLRALAGGYANIVLAALALLLLTPLYLRLLGPAQWGLVALCLTVHGLLFALDALLAPPLLRDVAQADAAAPRVLRAYLRFYLCLGLAVLVLAQLMLSLLPAWAAVSPALARSALTDPALVWPLRLALLSFFLQFCNSAAVGYWNGRRRQHQANRRQAAALLGRHALALVLITLWQPTALAYAGGFLLAAAAELLLNLRRVLADSLPAHAAAATQPQRFTRAVAGYAPAALLGLLSGQADRVCLALLLPTADYGHYFLLGTLALALLQLQLPIQRTFLPDLPAAGSAAAVLRLIWRAALLIVVLPALLLAAAAPWLLQAWLGDAGLAARGVTTLRLMLAGVVLIALYAPFGLLLLARRHHAVLGVINALALAVQLIVLLASPVAGSPLAGGLSWLAWGLAQWLGLLLARPWWRRAHD